jgi:Protein of unknown function (DUF1348)
MVRPSAAGRPVRSRSARSAPVAADAPSRHILCAAACGVDPVLAVQPRRFAIMIKVDPCNLPWSIVNHARPGFRRSPSRRLSRKWDRELEYRLIKELWAYEGNRIAVRFAYEWHDKSGNWYPPLRQREWGVRRRRPDAHAARLHQRCAHRRVRPQVPLATGPPPGRSPEPERPRPVASCLDTQPPMDVLGRCADNRCVASQVTGRVGRLADDGAHSAASPAVRATAIGSNSLQATGPPAKVARSKPLRPLATRVVKTISLSVRVDAGTPRVAMT